MKNCLTAVFFVLGEKGRHFETPQVTKGLITITNNRCMRGGTALSDEMIIEKIISVTHAEEAIRFLYERDLGKLQSYIITNGGSAEDANDIFQEVILNFITTVRAGKFRGASSISTFLFSMNRFAWLNELKRKGRSLQREKNYDVVNAKVEEDAAAALEAAETRGIFAGILKRLGEPCKEILLMFYYENKSFAEILPFTSYENEQVLRNKKAKCMQQLVKIIGQNPAQKQLLKSYLHG